MSDDGLVAYSARRGTEQFCVVGDVRSQPYKRVGPPVLTPDGRTVAHTADDSFVVVNGRAGPRFAWVGHVVLSRDGAHVAYAAQDDAHRAFVVVDHVPGPAFDRVTPPALAGAVVAYGARRHGSWFLVAGGRETPVDGEIASVFLGPDGARAGAVLDAHIVVTADSRGPRYDWIGWPAFLPDGRATYFAARGPTKLIVAGDREIDLGECTVWEPVLDGSSLTFSLRRDRDLWRRTLRLR